MRRIWMVRMIQFSPASDQQQLHNQFTLQYTSAPLSSLSPSDSCYIVPGMRSS
ncbi:MAG TPA: hypothetical protein VE524_09600 [Nitrososphaeraceae archaeon]|nr:hypothetical protein [Nitrososphaeraceae archaeon]